MGGALFATLLVGAALAAQRPTTVTTHRIKLGVVLANARGFTLYMFAADRNGKSTCYGGCAGVWPPLLTSGRVVAKRGSGVESRLLGTTRRKDGKLQVTYNHYPLYLYTPDLRPGDACGESSTSFGAPWWVLNTAGKLVKGGPSGPDCF